jgi:hypothetical protein
MIPLNPLAKATDYQSMLRRIFAFTTIVTCGAVWLLRRYLPQLDTALAQLDFEIELPYVNKVKVLGYFLPAIAFATFAYSIRLHDRLSDIFRIRYFFDTRKIIRPMALAVGVDEERMYLFTVPRLATAALGALGWSADAGERRTDQPNAVRRFASRS